MGRSGETTTSGIQKWELTDKPQMDDFNGVITEVDTALTGKADLNGATFTNIVRIPSGSRVISDADYMDMRFSKSNNTERFAIYHQIGTNSLGIILTDQTNSAQHHSITLGVDKGVVGLRHNDGSGNTYGSIWNSFISAIPSTDNAIDVGSGSKRIKQIYAANSTINTSDRRQKENIISLAADKAISFLKALNPVSYKSKDGTSGRTHYGFVAQQVKEAMDSVGLTDMDFAGYVESPVVDDAGKETGEYTYGLRYSEFIPLLLKVVQEQQKRIEALEAK